MIPTLQAVTPPRWSVEVTAQGKVMLGFTFSCLCWGGELEAKR
jgi:hypothetical protein